MSAAYSRRVRVIVPRLSRSALTWLVLAGFLVLDVQGAAAQEWSLLEGPFGGSVVALDRIGSGATYAMRNDTAFRTTDEGAQWEDVGPSASAFTLLAFDVTESGAIWAGTSGRGVAWSLNGGVTWTNNQITSDPHSGLGATIVAIAVDSEGRILAGPFRSVNQGASFQPMSISALEFALDAGGEVLAGTVDGVWRSSNGGASWVSANAGMQNERVVALATSGAADVWAGTVAGGVWHSTDSGLTWVLRSVGLSGASIEAIEVLPTSVRVSTAGGGLFGTTDDGLSWSSVNASPTEISDLLFAGGDLWLGTRGTGVLRSADGGATAQPANAAEMYATGLSDLVSDGDGTLYLASVGSGVFRSTNAGTSWSSSSASAPRVVSSIATTAPSHVWAAGWTGVFATTDAGATWSLAGFPEQRTREILALTTGEVIVVVDDELNRPTVQRSTNSGQSWAEAWSSSAVFRLEASTVSDGGVVLLGGSSFFGGLLLRSTDAGATWDEGQVGFQGIEALAAAPGGRVWAALADNVLHRSTDDGLSWTPLPNGGWPTGTSGSLSAIEFGPDGLLLVGTGSVYRSTDDGDSWTPFSSGLSSGSVVTMLASTSSGTFAGTYASGIFRRVGATDAPEPVRANVSALRVAPNPFREATHVSWDLPRSADVRVVVHDVGGRRIAELSPGVQPAGPGGLTWNGITQGRPVPPGAYFLRWDADGHTETTKLLRVR